MERLVGSLLVVFFILSNALSSLAQTPTTSSFQPVPAAVPQSLQQLQTAPAASLTPPAPTATAQPVVGQNLPPATPAPIPVVIESTPSSLPPGFPQAAPAANAPNGQTSTAPAVTAPYEERFVPSEVVAALPPTKLNEIRAVLRTSVGDITIKLDRVNAPLTVAHFVGLSRGEKEFIDVKTSKPVKRPFYNGLIFHRVVKGTLIQTGCPFGTGRGGPGANATIADEIKPNMKFSKPGMVAMAPMRENNGVATMKNANGSQFFISLREMPEWNNQYTIFGEVEDGMDVVQKIASSKVGPTERPIKRIYLVAVEIIEQ